jgi:hypothetical protein
MIQYKTVKIMRLLRKETEQICHEKDKDLAGRSGRDYKSTEAPHLVYDLPSIHLQTSGSAPMRDEKSERDEHNTHGRHCFHSLGQHIRAGSAPMSYVQLVTELLINKSRVWCL